MARPGTPYGLVAEFADADALLEACAAARREGYERIDAHVPFPVHGLDEALGIRRTILPWIVLAAAIGGAVGGFALQYWVSVIEYPLNIGGKPFFSWPSFIPVIFECTILAAGVTCVFGMLALNGLPCPYHPVFNTPGFERASRDRFFLAVEATDPRYEPARTRAFLEALGPEAVSDVVW